MDLKEARAIARRVGATIEEKNLGSPLQDESLEYVVRLGVCRIGSNGTREEVKFHYTSPALAANGAVIETARACARLSAIAKEVYVDSDLIFLGGGEA